MDATPTVSVPADQAGSNAENTGPTVTVPQARQALRAEQLVIDMDKPDVVIHYAGSPTGESEPATAKAAVVPIADPAPLGLTALALPLFALSWINIGMMEHSNVPVVLASLLFYGGLGQLIVALWETRRGNMFGTVAFGTFGCFNLALWYFLSYGMEEIPKAQHGGAMALFLAVWAVPAAILWVASFRTTVVTNVIFLLATALFVVAAWGNGANIDWMLKAGGWIGIALAATAWYGCAAALFHHAFGRTVLPNPSLEKQ
jgi:succinate-acetate transporter protein